MRKQIVIILLILASCSSDKISKSELDDFSNIEIKFRTGDETIESYSMNIFKDGEKIKAIKKRPLYFYGSKTDSTWVKELGNKDLKLITEFVNKAKILENINSSTYSSSIDYYEIKIVGEKKIKITGNYDWNGMGYQDLERKIFVKEFIDLENKREIVKDSIVSSFNGIWDVIGWKNGVLKSKNLVLERTSENEPQVDGIYRWTFNKSKELELKKGLDIDEGSSLIKISGSTYKILKIGINKIELKYLW